MEKGMGADWFCLFVCVCVFFFLKQLFEERKKLPRCGSRALDNDDPGCGNCRTQGVDVLCALQLGSGIPVCNKRPLVWTGRDNHVI